MAQHGIRFATNTVNEVIQPPRGPSRARERTMYTKATGWVFAAALMVILITGGACVSSEEPLSGSEDDQGSAQSTSACPTEVTCQTGSKDPFVRIPSDGENGYYFRLSFCDGTRLDGADISTRAGGMQIYTNHDTAGSCYDLEVGYTINEASGVNDYVYKVRFTYEKGTNLKPCPIIGTTDKTCFLLDDPPPYTGPSALLTR
jgi:hypothetical protein